MIAAYAGGAAIDGTPARLAPAGGVTKKKRAKRIHTGHRTRVSAFGALRTFLPGEMGPRGLLPPTVTTGAI